MKKIHYTVVVVGGGPAGAAAASTLASRGLDVCIVDKSVFPRDKLCGGLLTLRSKKIFNEVFNDCWNSVIEHTSNGVSFFYKSNLLNSVNNYSELFFTKRINFDYLLLNIAKNNGAKLYPGAGVIRIDLTNKTCLLANGQEIGFNYIVGADGVNSIVSRTIFGKSFNKDTIAFALEMEVNRKDSPFDIVDPEIYFGIASWGYGWIFPKKSTLTVGIGGLHKKNPDIKNKFKRFLLDKFGKIPSEKIKGHYLPFGNYRKVPGNRSALLCGDAAGLVEPITGEGIAFAMQSGYLAGLSIIEAISSNCQESVLAIYQKKYSEISRALDHANMMKYLLFPKVSEYLFVKTLPKTKHLPKKHMDLMADEIRYEDYVRYLMAKIFKGVVKRVLFIKK